LVDAFPPRKPEDLRRILIEPIIFLAEAVRESDAEAGAGAEVEVNLKE
jgi:hypothetical protein